MASAEREREIYGRVVARLAYVEPSMLIHELDALRAEPYTAADLVEVWRGAVKLAPAGAAWNMYVHVPYCKSICSFCNYKRLRVSSREALDRYVRFIVSEAALFGDALSGARVGALYVGGGTPSVLAPDQLERLLGGLHDAFVFDEGAQKNFEYDPMVMTPERFAVVARFGFTRYSFGVQSIDVEVNALHNRGRQSPAHVDRQFALLEEHGAEAVNVDFLLGLDGTSPESMLAEVGQTLATHRPDEVSVYFVHPTPAYVGERFGGSLRRFEEHLAPFARLAPGALAQLAARHDYALASSGRHVVVLRNLRRSGREHRSESDYCDIPSQIHRPLFLIGLGDSARSRIHGRMRYRAEHDDADIERVAPRYVGTPIDLRDEMFGYLALTFRDAEHVSRSRFMRTFGVDLVAAYPKALAKLNELGAVTVDAEHVTMKTSGRRERLRDTLFFLSRARRRDLESLV